MIANSIIIFVTPLAILFAAGVAWLGNYHVQRRILDHIRLTRSVDELKTRLRDFVDLLADYWTLDSPRSEKHRTLEAYIIARKRLISSELIEVKYQSTRLRETSRRTNDVWHDLCETATGGCFQQENWQPDPNRVAVVASEVSTIIISLNKAH